MRTYLKPIALASALVLAMGGLAAAEQELERIVSCETGPGGITVTVETGGCTAKADFAVSSTANGGKTGIELRRTKADTCKGNFPEGLKLQFTWAELKLAPGTQYALKNELQPGATGKQACAGTVPAAASAGEAQPAKTYHHRRHRHHHYRHRHHMRDCECFCPCDF